MKKIIKAFLFAAWAHRHQKRKYTGLPYIVHPVHVAWIVSRVTKDEDMIVAALGHDLIEDVGVTKEQIAWRFGDRVAQLVDDLTDVSTRKDGNRARRKHIDLLHTARGSADAHTIKLADLIANTKDILKRDKDFARTYLKEKILLLEVLKDGNPILWARAKSQAEKGLASLENT